MSAQAIRPFEGTSRGSLGTGCACDVPPGGIPSAAAEVDVSTLVPKS